MSDINISTSTLEELSRLKAGYLPKPLFDEVVRLVVTPTIVIIPIYNNNEVLLLERELDDPFLGGLWHTPGSVLLATDSSIEAALKRILESEIGIEINPSLCKFSHFVFESIPRGKEISLIYRLDLDHKETAGNWFDINVLPENIVQTDIHRINSQKKT